MCAALGVALGSLGISCVERNDDLDATGSETHFLIECSESCAAGLQCIDGACTSPCSSDEVCAGWSAAAVCSALPGATEPGVCDVQCGVAADCATLGAGYRCQSGACRSATSVGADQGAQSLPLAFDVLELRRIDNDEPPGAGSNCDPRDLDSVYFIDLPAGQVSWRQCTHENGRNIWVSSAGQWTMNDGDRAVLLGAYAQLQAGASGPCLGPGGTFVDVTTAGSSRFSYGDESFIPCDVGRIGRAPIGNVYPLYEALAELSFEHGRGEPDPSTDR